MFKVALYFLKKKKNPLTVQFLLIHVLTQVTLILILTETRYMYYDHFNGWRRIEVTLILQIKINIPISKYIYPKNLTKFWKSCIRYINVEEFFCSINITILLFFFQKMNYVVRFGLLASEICLKKTRDRDTPNV